MTAPVRLAVDLIACDGRGLCAELLPELITLDDWGYPLLSGHAVPAELRGEASAVVQLCPGSRCGWKQVRPDAPLEAGNASQARWGFMMLSPSNRILVM